MKSLIVATAITIGAFSSGAAASSIFGAKGEFSTFLSRLEYDPSSACSKPSKPYSSDQYAFDSYKRGISTYVSCLEDAANSDIRYATEVVKEGYDEAMEELTSEIKRGY
ncbi:hypothetical protein [Sphingobium boeckii]|uniref:Uncharacterized protein n=1 Tax=Sphingobium boeckii TaxID=1082345 RepID=A0A7W9AH75_9SPHN|nr:hypothetical protein [Sphingobium boeckii]MBB5685642.1 hypothetical protein [Sphingobium boeckii]